VHISFRKIDPSTDFNFFSRVRRESSYYLDDARNFNDFEVKIFLESNQINYKIVALEGKPIGYVRSSVIDYEGRQLRSVGLDLASEFRGKNYAIPIYKKLIEELSQLDLQIVLWVLDFNVRAMHIYNVVGFKKIESHRFKQKGSGRYCKQIMMEYKL